MGGRGTFAAGNPVPYSYQTVDYIEGVKVLEGINGKHGLPESAHSSEAYIKLKPDGTFHEMRFYDNNHVLYLEIGYHAEKPLTGDSKKPVLHYHTYDSSFSKTKVGDGGRTKAKFLTEEMINRYKKYFKGVKL
jgi:hypothetical protein